MNNLKQKLQKLLKLRKQFVEDGDGMGVLGLNEQIASVARRLKIDYYSLN